MKNVRKPTQCISTLCSFVILLTFLSPTVSAQGCRAGYEALQSRSTIISNQMAAAPSVCATAKMGMDHVAMVMQYYYQCPYGNAQQNRQWLQQLTKTYYDYGSLAQNICNEPVTIHDPNLTAQQRAESVKQARINAERERARQQAERRKKRAQSFNKFLGQTINVLDALNTLNGTGSSSGSNCGSHTCAIPGS